MFSWHYTETVETDAPAEAIWSLWSTPSTWHTWDSEVKSAEIHGDFVQGAKGIMQPTSGPKVAFTLTKVARNECFTNRAKLPLATLDFSHFYSPKSASGTAGKLTHSVTIRGLLAPLFRLLIGRSVRKHLRSAMLNLADQADTDIVNSLRLRSRDTLDT